MKHRNTVTWKQGGVGAGEIWEHFWSNNSQGSQTPGLHFYLMPDAMRHVTAAAPSELRLARGMLHGTSCFW